MTDDLKQQFERLVADPPPPSTVPSESVFARVRSVRRRRTAGALSLAAAAVVAVAVATSNLTDIGSSPPVTNTPSAPVTIVTGPPTSTQSTVAPTTTGTTTTGKTTTTHGTTTGTPGAGTTQGTVKPTGTTTTGAGTTTTPPPVQPIQVGVVLKPTVTGRTVAVKVTVSGTVIVPTVDGKNLPADTSFLNLSGGTNYYWGDGDQGGSDGGSAGCGGTTRKTGRETYSIETHTYAKPGTYTLRYEVRYCTAKNTAFTFTKTIKVTVK